MGNLHYGSTDQPIRIDDIQLAHLRVVVTTKFRRGESFPLSWIHSSDTPGGRSTVWLQPAIPLRFVFDSAESAELDPALLRQMAEQANSAAGLTIDVSSCPAQRASSLPTFRAA